MESPKRFYVRHWPLLVATTCTIILTIIYLPCFSSSSFTIDDDTLIDLPQLKAPLSLRLLETLFTPGKHIDFYPIRDLAYWFQIHILQAEPHCLNMTVYRLFSLGLFFGILLFIGRILQRRAKSILLNSLLVGIFALSPFHSEILMWASAQKDLLAILFGLIAVDHIDLWTRSQTEAKSPHWVLATLFFTLSFMSKASLVLVPPVLFLAFLENPFGLCKERRKIALYYSAALLVLASAWAIFQTKVYEDINDMRFFYPISYRISASAAALGREICGLFYPALNIVDVENWGSWLRYNSHFAPVGFIFYALYLAGLIYSYFRRNLNLTLILLAVAALYLPTSGLIFRHRNFYSTRYFEPTLVFGLLIVCPAISRLTFGRISKQIIPALVVLSASLLYLSYQESEVWSSARSTIEKSLSRQPDRISLKAYLLTTLRQEYQWGRLTAQEENHMKSLEDEIQTYCGLAQGTSPPTLLVERDDCIWTWMETLLDPKSRGTPRFQKASAYLQEARIRLLPERVEQLELRTEVIEASYGLRPYLSVAPSVLINKSGYETTPQGRARLIAALCLTGHTNEATRLSELYFTSLLLDPKEVSEVALSSRDKFKSETQQGLERRKLLQSCFNWSHP